MDLIPRLLSTWRRPGAAVRAAADLSEPGVLALLMGTMAVYFVAQWPVHARAAALDPSVPLDARMAGALLATMFLMPLLVLGAAAAGAAVLRAGGRRIGGRHARIALVWALAAAAPAMLLAGLVQGLIGPGPGLILVRLVAGAASLVFWIAGLRALSHAGVRA